MKKANRIITDLILFTILVIIDRITKNWADTTLKTNGPIDIIKNVVEFYYLPNGNTGAAFGMLSGHRVLFLVIAIVVVTAIGYLVFNMPTGRKYRFIEILLVFIASGGVGNMIDRVVFGTVTDFIYISYINFPIFNVADMYVSVCTVILAVVVLFCLKESDHETLENAFKAPLKRFRKKSD